MAPGPRPRALRELLVIALMFAAYKAGRVVAAKHVDSAFSNAYVVWDLERILRLPDELSVQTLVLRNLTVTRAANVYYAAVHFPATAAFLIWLYLRRPFDYLWLRRTLALLTATGLLLHLAVPVAPPRMLGRLGFIDTADLYGPAVYGPPGPNSLADQYAAMPSLHIGWALLVAIGVIATTRSRWRWLILIHPVATALVVVATANHFWLDGLVAAGMLVMSLVVVGALAHWRRRDAESALGAVRGRLSRWRRGSRGGAVEDFPVLGLPESASARSATASARSAVAPGRSAAGSGSAGRSGSAASPCRPAGRSGSAAPSGSAARSASARAPSPADGPPPDPLPAREPVAALPDRLPPRELPPAPQSAAGAEDLADVAGDRGDR